MQFLRFHNKTSLGQFLPIITISIIRLKAGMELTEVFVLLVDDVLGGGGDCLYLEDSEGFVVVLFYDGA